MNKHHLHHLFTKLRIIKPYYFLILALVWGVICLFALRSNNQHMLSLRQAVYNADKDNGDIEGSLQNLQAYVTSHMNTELAAGPSAVYPPIQLKYTYDRLVEKQNLQLQQANAQIYTAAQAYCEQQNSHDFSGRNRVPCIEQYVTSHGVKIAPIADGLYKFAFVSPKWSPDLAGWSKVFGFLSLFAAAFWWLVTRWLRSKAS
ncbi:MAG TPA: hypothetical protein VLG37_05545 [Candidatus Saccharimonadales bacterium]|nr:hypothetical protein [Candidatus Saccharimonadales bacterium]